MKVFVTGGAGYIGSTAAAELIRVGHEVVVFDNLSQGHRSAVPHEAAFVQGDLADRLELEQELARHEPHAVMHFASRTLVSESMERPLRYLGENVRCGLNLIESAVQCGVRRFILSSTANVFGHPERIPIDEGVSIAPGSPYGESKNILERILSWMDRLCGMRYAALRYFNAAGAANPDLGEHHDPETHLIPQVLQVALGQREKLIVFGDDYDTPDGTCIRDYVHVVDLARAHILALHALDRGSRTYHLGAGRGFSVKEVIETARAVTGHPIPAEIGPRRPGDPPVLIASSDKIKRELGWQPAHPELRDIIESAWQWHHKHPAGYAS